MSTHPIISLLHRKYLSMVNLNEVTDLITADVDNLSAEFQRDVLHATIMHEKSKQYPPSVAYRKSFLKKILDKLESSGMEVIDDLYEEYAALMMQGNIDMQCFKTYVVPECTVTLRENQQIISGGTTGLCTWQASQHLAEWAMENKQLFENRSVLELGSGLGLTGLVISKTCDPNKYIFSDFHEQVLQKLAGNIVLNCTKCTHVLDNSSVHCEETEVCRKLSPETTDQTLKYCDKCRTASTSVFNSTYSEICEKYWNLGTTSADGNSGLETYLQLNTDDRVHLCQLDWEHFKKEIIIALFDEVDTIVAADVVYDPCIVPALVNILNVLLDRKLRNFKKPVAYIASTVRNPDTRDKFIETLDSAGIKWTEVASPKKPVLFYDRDVPIQILKLHC